MSKKPPKPLSPANKAVPFFASPKRQRLLLLAVQEWAGTPFHESLLAPGKGANCVRFVSAVYARCGVPVSAVEEPPVYVLTHGIHHTESALIQWLETVQKSLRSNKALGYSLVTLDREESFMAGDLIVLKSRQTPHHLALCDGVDRLAHIHYRFGFLRESISLHKAQRSLHSGFRLLTSISV